MGNHTFVFRLDERLSRQLASLLSNPKGGYASLDEFLSVAIQNQLGIEESESVRSPSAGSSEFSPLLLSPLEMPDALAAVPPQSKDRLFVLTNRLGPIKVAARVLAVLGSKGAWPALEEFQIQAAKIARQIGLRLRDEDSELGRRGSARRWIAFPVGEDERAACSRFITSFTMDVTDGKAYGPMIVLGLATSEKGKAILTEPGWRLANAASPLLDRAEGVTLSREEGAILRQQVQRAPGEFEAVTEFIQIIKRSAGNQARIDELLAARYSDWTETLAVAHRSAMIGRLSDLGVLDISGRGPHAKVSLTSSAGEFLAGTTTEGAA